VFRHHPGGPHVRGNRTRGKERTDDNADNHVPVDHISIVGSGVRLEEV
jgi:hypothetical protein